MIYDTNLVHKQSSPDPLQPFMKSERSIFSRQCRWGRQQGELHGGGVQGGQIPTKYLVLFIQWQQQTFEILFRGNSKVLKIGQFHPPKMKTVEPSLVGKGVPVRIMPYSPKQQHHALSSITPCVRSEFNLFISISFCTCMYYYVQLQKYKLVEQ